MADLGLPKAQCPLFSVPGDQRRYRTVGKQQIVTVFTGETREINALDITFTSDSTYLTGTNLTYSSARGSAAIKITGTVSGIGGYEGIHIAIATSGAIDTDGYGTIGIKCVVTNSAAMTDGEVYGGQFIAKHASTSTMLATASLIGLDAWAYISSSGPARTVIGANLGVHNECSGAFGAGSVIRAVQVVCDENASAQSPVEATGICIWNMAGEWDNAINIVNSSSGFTNFVKFTDDGSPAQDSGTVSGSQAGWIKVLVGDTTCYIPLYPSVS